MLNGGLSGGFIASKSGGTLAVRDLVSRARYRVPLAVGGVVLLAIGQVVWNASASAYPGVGDITEYYIPTAHSLPKGIAAGPDGNLVHRVANADLLTGTSGYNQDIGIFVSDNGGVDTLLAWKESGGFAGTFSPNAAFVQTSYPMTAGHTYVFKLKWKTNKNASGATIYAAAGGPPEFSPTRLTVELTDPPPPPTLISDGINNAFASAIGLGTVGCGGSAARSGTTYPGGTEDWFVFTWSVGPAGCTHAGLTLTATSGIQADINTDATTTILSSATGPTVLTTSGTFYVRVYGASTGDIGTWVIVIATF
jgi:hypothetical protein